MKRCQNLGIVIVLEVKLMIFNSNFIDAVNILSLILQIQNAESFKVDQMRESVEDKIDNQINKKLDMILKELEQIKRKI